MWRVWPARDRIEVPAEDLQPVGGSIGVEPRERTHFLLTDDSNNLPFLRNYQEKMGTKRHVSAPQCSVPCGVGQQRREVVCVSNQGDVENDQECNVNLRPESLQNCDMGACARSWFTSLWSQRVTQKCVVHLCTVWSVLHVTAPHL